MVAVANGACTTPASTTFPLVPVSKAVPSDDTFHQNNIYRDVLCRSGLGLGWWNTRAGAQPRQLVHVLITAIHMQ